MTPKVLDYANHFSGLAWLLHGLPAHPPPPKVLPRVSAGRGVFLEVRTGPEAANSGCLKEGKGLECYGHCLKLGTARATSSASQDFWRHPPYLSHPIFPPLALTYFSNPANAFGSTHSPLLGESDPRE